VKVLEALERPEIIAWLESDVGEEWSKANHHLKVWSGWESRPVEQRFFTIKIDRPGWQACSQTTFTKDSCKWRDISGNPVTLTFGDVPPERV
jgi:hypothetical protein